MTKSTILSLFAILLLLSSCQESEKKSTKEVTEGIVKNQIDLSEYTQKGKTIAKATFIALSGQLKTALQAGGVPAAIELCNVSAYPTIDGLSAKYNANIRRTSLKIRNPKDTPTAGEAAILQQYEEDFAAAKKLAPISKARDEHIVDFYAPIIMKKACLQCHGILGESLTQENYNIIKKHYPTDNAIGYKEGDLRGIWSIEFSKN